MAEISQRDLEWLNKTKGKSVTVKLPPPKPVGSKPVPKESTTTFTFDDGEQETVKNEKPKPLSPWDRLMLAVGEGMVHSNVGGAAAARRGIGLARGETNEEISDEIRRSTENQTRIRETDDLNFKDVDTLSPANIGKLTVDVLGNVVGGVDPTYVLAPGASVLARIAAQMGINAGVDVVNQGIELQQDIREDYDPRQTGINAAAGAVFQGAGEGFRYRGEQRASQRARESSELVMPVEGRITSEIGPRKAPKAGASTNHGGIDIAAPVGTPVRAPGTGVVKKVGRKHAKRGNWVEIEHPDGTTTRYLHLSGFKVRPGDAVDKGDIFARSGKSGNVTGAHLHWSAMRDGKVVDPRSINYGGGPMGPDGAPAAESVRSMDPLEIARIMGDTEMEDALLSRQIDEVLEQANDSDNVVDFDIERMVRGPRPFEDFEIDDVNYAKTFLNENTDFNAGQLRHMTNEEAMRFAKNKGFNEDWKNFYDASRRHSYDDSVEVPPRPNIINFPTDKDVLTPAERQEMDASVNPRDVPNLDSSHEKFTPFVESNDLPTRAANDKGRRSVLRLMKDLWKDESGTVRVFHGTTKNIQGPLRETDYSGKLGKGFYVTTDPKYASVYATAPKNITEGANVMPFNVDESKIFGFNKIDGWTHAELKAAADELGFGGRGFDSDIRQHFLNDESFERFKNAEKINSGTVIRLLQNRVGKDRLNELLIDRGYTGIAGNMAGDIEINIFNPNRSLASIFKDMMKDESGEFRGDPPEDVDPKSKYDGLDPFEKMSQAIKDSGPVRREQDELYHQARSQQDAKISAIRSKGGSAKDIFTTLEGELPKADFESIAEHFTPEDIKTIEQHIIGHKNLRNFEVPKVLKAVRGLFDPEGSRVPTPSALELMNEVFPTSLIKALSDKTRKMSGEQLGLELLNTPKALVSSGDISAPGRQGFVFVGRKEFWANLPEQINFMAKEENFQKAMEDIKNHDNYVLAREADLAVRDIGHLKIGEREEAFAANLPEEALAQLQKHMPGGKYVPNVYRASDRAYTGFLRKLRFDVFNTLIQKGRENGINWEKDKKALKALGSFINSATGRGDLASFGKTVESAAPLLNAIMFSPKFLKSRVDFTNPFFYLNLWRASPFVAKEAFKDGAKFLAAEALILSLAVAGGAEVVRDLRSSDSLKIKIGDTRIDTFAGFKPLLTLYARLGTGETKTLKGKVKDIRMGKDEAGGFGEQTGLGVLSYFFRSKGAPLPGSMANWLDGKDITGREFEYTREGAKLMAPMWVPGLIETLQKEGPKGAWVVIPDLIGWSTQTYAPTPSKSEKKALKELGLGKDTADWLEEQQKDPMAKDIKWVEEQLGQ